MTTQRSCGMMKVCGRAGKGLMNINSSTVRSSKSVFCFIFHLQAKARLSNIRIFTHAEARLFGCALKTQSAFILTS